MRKTILYFLLINFFILTAPASDSINESIRKDLNTADSFVTRYNSEKEGIPSKKSNPENEKKYQEYKTIMDQKDAIIDNAFNEAKKDTKSSSL